MSVRQPSEIEPFSEHFSLTQYTKEVEESLRTATIPYMFETLKKQCRRKGVSEQLCQKVQDIIMKFISVNSEQLYSKLEGLLQSLSLAAEDGILCPHIHDEFLENCKKSEEKREKVTIQIRSLLEQYCLKVQNKLFRKNIQMVKEVMKSANVKFSHERDFSDRFKQYPQVIDYMKKVRDFTVEFKKMLQQKIAEQTRLKQL